MQSYQSAQLGAWDHPTPANCLSSGQGLSQLKGVQASHTHIFNLWRGTAHNPLLGQGPGVPSLGTGPCYKDSPDKGVSTMYNMTQPSLSWQQTVREQGPENSSQLREASADECQQPSMLPLMGRILLPPAPAPQDSRALPPPFCFRHTAAPRFTLYSCSAESQPQYLAPMTSRAGESALSMCLVVTQYYPMKKAGSGP